MPRFDDYTHALRLDYLLDRFGNLGGEAFLNLQPPRKKFDQAWNFAQANHFSIRNISDVYLPEERQHVMLAQAEHFDVFHDNHFVVANRKQSALQQSFGIFLVSLGEILHGFMDALGRGSQALARWIFA